jgi:hypothetical protein
MKENSDQNTIETDEKVTLVKTLVDDGKGESPNEGHKCGPDCEDHGTKRKKGDVQPTREDIEKATRKLNSSGYGKIKERFNRAFVLRNIKTGMVVELRAASSTHACTMIGWRPNNVRLLNVIELEKKEVDDGTKPAEQSAEQPTAQA